MLAPDYQTERRMELKRRAVPLPDLAGKRVLDVGTDMAWWARLASDAGASHVLGLDRNRAVRGEVADLIAMNRAQGLPRCWFEQIEIGKQYRNFGQFDVVLCLSVYHHLYEAAGGDHAAIWFWLSRHVAQDGVLLWEGPTDDSDPVVRANVSASVRGGYTQAEIIRAASVYFDPEYIGPALHEPTREVWRFRPVEPEPISYSGTIRSGAGGATKAFEYADGRRANEIWSILGSRPMPGSLNLRLGGPFDWNAGYYRAQILDVVDRARGLGSEWAPRWARFYPVRVDGEFAYAFRFEGENYGLDFMELISQWRLRDTITGPKVRITRC